MRYSLRNPRRLTGRRGFTLIEVLVGCALLVLLLGAFVTLVDSMRKQRLGAERLTRAARGIDRLLTEWSISNDGIPLSGEGLLPGESGMRWHAVRMGTDSTDEFFARVRIVVQVDESSMTDRLPLMTIDVMRTLDADEPRRVQ